ncbi:MAG: histidine--tRNA ligase [Sutterellaceae bacterium]|nr:histidine--tRNA ligase [Burkholderiaceae bacterium]MCX7901555.1 histidine--tRNA ligase [Burkholderiaceae bacterium]MDW8429062.1 histidine--tRNA ligase [Sutterellaceae bacterium]
MSKPRLAAVRGMNDLLPSEAPLWEWFEARVLDWLRSYGYQQIRTPILEHTEVFVRGIGEVTDIVEKEMYSFEDRLNGEQLTLRPEFTAGVIRAVLEHNLTYDGPRRLWSIGPVFRHERPQRGRYRQFHQVNVEALGFAGPDIDAEHIVMLARLWKIVGLTRIRLELNCLGQAEERARYRTDLIAYFERHLQRLDADARRRLYTNPLRILDSKNAELADVVAGAPRITDYLSAESRGFFERLQSLLTAAGVAFTVNPRLVRGLDYYNLTVYEWITDALGSQGTVCGGGRYDPLAERMGGRSTPGCGFAIGMERVIELLRACGQGQTAPALDVYVVHQGGATAQAAFLLAERLRDAGLDVAYHAGEASLKSQMKKADASGAEFAVIIGERELAAGEAAIKALRAQNAQAPFARQSTVPQEKLAEALIDALTDGSPED